MHKTYHSWVHTTYSRGICTRCVCGPRSGIAICLTVWCAPKCLVWICFVYVCVSMRRACLPLHNVRMFIFFAADDCVWTHTANVFTWSYCVHTNSLSPIVRRNALESRLVRSLLQSNPSSKYYCVLVIRVVLAEAQVQTHHNENTTWSVDITDLLILQTGQLNKKWTTLEQTYSTQKTFANTKKINGQHDRNRSRCRGRIE